jgi:hypothetical protein
VLSRWTFQRAVLGLSASLGFACGLFAWALTRGGDTDRGVRDETGRPPTPRVIWCLSKSPMRVVGSSHSALSGGGGCLVQVNGR